MKNKNVSRIIDHIDEKYIDEAIAFDFGSNKEPLEQNSAFTNRSTKRPHRIRRGVLAACLAMFIVFGSIATGFAVDAAEYKNAVSFFEENGLSTDGLSRSEIKAVYRDITTKSFTYGKTAEVLKQTVPGREIEQDEPAPEELAAIWDKNVWMKSVSEKGYDYKVEYRDVYSETKGFDVIETSILECYHDGEKLWAAEFGKNYIDGYERINDATIVWGENEVYSSFETVLAFVALVDNSGKIMWQKRLVHGFKDEYIETVLRKTDGTLAVISRGDFKYLCLSCYNADGEELNFYKTEVGKYGIANAAILGDGYIVQLWNQFKGDTALLYKMDQEGVLTDSFSYEADDCDYYIKDMIEFEGRVYLSAYEVPKQYDEGGRHEIANILDYVFSNEGLVEISSEELTPVVRNNYTAILLECDPEGGIPKTFYSVQGSLGGKLSVNNANQLEWDVESIISTFYSPATSSFTIGGNCKVFRYTFDVAGDLIDQKDTGDTVPYRR